MAKLLPLLTAAAMIGVIGGMVMWLIVVHRESVAFEAGRPPNPAVDVEVRPRVSPSSPNSSSMATKTAGQSFPSRSVEEPLISPPQIGTLPAPLPSDATFSPRAFQAGPVRTIALVQPGAARGGTPVPAPFGTAPLAAVAGGIDDALSFALEAAEPYVKEGFTIREDYWGGDLPVKEAKAVVHQLFKGNDYWFWMGADQDGAKITAHVYDGAGRLAEKESWQKPHKAAARVVPKKTGAYYVIVEVEKSPEEHSSWALAYGFR